jgi:hypothetical protein
MITYVTEDLSIEYVKDIELQSEIDALTSEMDGICIDTLKFDKWDYIAIFSIGLLEVGADFLFGNPKDGLQKKMSDKNDKLGGFFNKIHEDLDHSKQPLDYQGFKFGGGDHRSRTYAHDLIMFPLAIYMLCKGEFIDGYYENNTYNPVSEILNQFGNEYAGMPPDQAICAYLVHMTADFFSARSLPVPGFGILAHFPSHDVRKFVADLYSGGFNLRHLISQGIPVLCTEFMMRIYFYIRYWGSTVPAAVKQHKFKILDPARKQLGTLCQRVDHFSPCFRVAEFLLV